MDGWVNDGSMDGRLDGWILSLLATLLPRPTSAERSVWQKRVASSSHGSHHAFP